MHTLDLVTVKLIRIANRCKIFACRRCMDHSLKFVGANVCDKFWREAVYVFTFSDCHFANVPPDGPQF